MAKLTTTDLANLTNETSAITTINANNALIETAMENTLSRDGTTPNTMSASFDMNSNNILNVAQIDATTITLDGISILSSLPSVTPKGDWVTSTAYVVGALVNQSNITYICNTAHTSGTFNTDKDTNGYWTVFATAPSLVQTPERFSGNASDVAFALSAEPASEDFISVFIDGVYQNHDQFSLSSATITFTTAPPTGTNNIEVQYTIVNTGTDASAAAASATAAAASAVTAAASAVTAAGVASTLATGWTFSTTTSMADPGTGILRFNHATIASVTAMAFDATSADSTNPDVSDFIAAWDDSNSTNAGVITIAEVDSPGNWHSFYVTAVTDNTGWLQVTVAHIGGVGTFADTDSLRVAFTRTGDKGDTGATGAAGSGSGDMLAAQNLADVDSASTSRTNLGVAIGSNVQAFGAVLDDFNTLGAASSDSEIIVATGAGAFAYESGTTLRTSIGVGTGDSPQVTGIELGHATDTTLTRSAAGTLAVEGVDVLMSTDTSIGQHTIFVPAGAMEAAVTTAAATSNAVEIGTSLFAARTMDFATDADDFAYFGIQMPKSWDAGTLVCQFVWSATGTTANTVLWAIAATSLGDDEVLTTAFPTPTSPAADTNSTTADDVMVSAEVTVTVGSTPTAEDYVIFEVSRDVSGDTLAEDARLHGIKIHYTTDTGSDT